MGNKPNLGYVLTSYEDAMRQRRAAREAAYEAYKERKLRMQRTLADRAFDAALVAAEYKAASTNLPVWKILTREDFFDPNN